MTLHLFRDLEQRSDEWYAARCGIVTASVVGRLLTPTLKVASNPGSRGLTASLAAERITGHVEEGYVSSDMWRGIMDEPIAREKYAEHYGAVEEIGFMVRDDSGFRLGYSPDGLVGDDGLIEIKSRNQKTHLQTILNDAVPAENMAQLQCGLLVSGRDWIDYVSFCGGMPLWRKRILPDAAWFAAIVEAVRAFEANVAEITERYAAAVEGLPTTDRTEHEEMRIG